MGFQSHSFYLVLGSHLIAPREMVTHRNSTVIGPKLTHQTNQTNPTRVCKLSCLSVIYRETEQNSLPITLQRNIQMGRDAKNDYGLRSKIGTE